MAGEADQYGISRLDEKKYKSSKELNVSMQLSGNILLELAAGIAPDEQLLQLPEKVLQFGTGVLLRGLPDYCIDAANRKGIFNGRIVVVKSTAGGTDAFRKQDGMYTLLERGIQDGKPVENIMINTSISRVLSAADEWEEILACAANPAMQLVISNTTEIGIVLVEPDAVNPVPVSYPGRLLAFLEERYRIFRGSYDAGMVIVPAELIVDNGTQLKHIVTTLAKLKGHGAAFMNWLHEANDFCNSLVDCIVPGKLPAAEHAAMERRLGYQDELMIMSEPYRLWAIETSRERTRQILSFSEVNSGVVITPDISKFRELKLRLLNGTHTFACALALLSGFTTVKEAMNDENFSRFVSALMLQEIAPLVSSEESITAEETYLFSQQVLDRFRNPYIEHPWISISVQYTSKMFMRCIPLISKHYSTSSEAPVWMSLGFAAYLLFTKPSGIPGKQYYTEAAGKTYPVQDDMAGILYEHWHSEPDMEKALRAIVSDIRLYGQDLTKYPHFTEAVQVYLAALMQQGAEKTLPSGILKQMTA